MLKLMHFDMTNYTKFTQKTDRIHLPFDYLLPTLSKGSDPRRTRTKMLSKNAFIRKSQ